MKGKYCGFCIFLSQLALYQAREIHVGIVAASEESSTLTNSDFQDIFDDILQLTDNTYEMNVYFCATSNHVFLNMDLNNILRNYGIQLLVKSKPENIIPDRYCSFEMISIVESNSDDIFIQYSISSHQKKLQTDHVMAVVDAFYKVDASSTDTIFCTTSFAQGNSATASLFYEYMYAEADVSVTGESVKFPRIQACDGDILITGISTMKKVFDNYIARASKYKRFDVEGPLIMMAESSFATGIRVQPIRRVETKAQTQTSTPPPPLPPPPPTTTTTTKGQAWQIKKQNTTRPTDLIDFEVTEKLHKSGECELWWPLNNAEIFHLDIDLQHRDFDGVQAGGYELPIGILCVFDKNTMYVIKVDFYDADEKKMTSVHGPYSVDKKERSSMTKVAYKYSLFGLDLSPHTNKKLIITIMHHNGQGVIGDVPVISKFEVNMKFSFAVDPPISTGYERMSKTRPRPPQQILLPDLAIYHNEMTRLTRNSFHRLLHAMNLTGVAAEIGIYEGEYAGHMLKQWRGSRYILIDPWMYWEAYMEGSDSQNEHELRFQRVIKQVKVHDKKAVVLRLRSDEAAQLIMNESLDFCYIDAQHDYYSVMQDIIAYWPKVRKGGILAGHDFDPNNWVYPLQLAVLEFARKLGLIVYTTGERDSRSWFVIKS